MTTLLLFHHALGQTPGFLSLADELRDAGHTVHAPDLYRGRTFDTLDEGVAYADEHSLDEVLRWGTAAAEQLPPDVTYVGFSLGIVPAQHLAQTRPGALGAVLCYGCVPTATFERPWPEGVPLQLHIAEDDAWSERDVAEALAEEVPDAELFLYPGSAHLFADPSAADYDEHAAAQLKHRLLAFLDRLG